MDKKRRSKFYDKEARQLITAITGFEEDEENFQLCHDFVLSNFLYHQFLDVDSFKVQRSLDGLCEKFLVHNDLERSKAFRSLSSKFIDIVSKEEIQVKETGYGILSLLIHLAGSVPNDDTTLLSEDEDDDDANVKEINWAEYLLEGEKECLPSSDDDTSCSEWEDDDSLEENWYIFNRPPSRVDSGIDVSPGSCSSSILPPLTEFRPYEEPKPKKPLLPRTPYWDLQYQKTSLETKTKNFDANFTRTWEKYLAGESPIYTPETNVVVTEYVVLRETLWMLHGVKDVYLFSWENHQFKVIKNIHMTHLTEVTLHELLSSLCPYGNKMMILNDFVNEASKADTASAHHCQTYQAYSSGVRYHLQQYSAVLTSFEKQIIDHRDALTIIQLIQKLKPHFDNLDLIFNIHKEVMMQIPQNCPTWERAARLLNSLWKQLIEFSFWASNKSAIQIILSLFLASCCPYFNLLEGVIMRGHLLDPYEEFLVWRDQQVNVWDENFWKTALYLQQFPPVIEKEFFLKPLFDDILLASKSMEMLRHLNSLFGVKSHTSDLPNYLYSVFIESLQNIYKDLTEEFSTANPLCGEDECDSQNKNSTIIASDLTEKYGKFADHYKKLFDFKNNCLDIEAHQKLVQKTVDMIQPNAVVILNLAVEEAMITCIKEVCNSTNRNLICVLREDHHLMSHISVIKKYFLMESGAVMFSFYTEIFYKIFSGAEWQDVSFIGNALKNAVLVEDKEITEKLSVHLTESNQVNMNQPLSLLNLLQLHYEVGWPINVILSNESQKQYCQIFCFLLQVKCAKYVLDQLFCSDLEKSVAGHVQQSDIMKIMAKDKVSVEQKIQGMYIIRMRLLHFINGFHNYIMTRILHSSGLELNDKLQNTESLEDMIVIHQQYLSSLHERCLLDSKLPYLREQILRVLNLALKFQRLWQSRVDKINVEDLRHIEQEFSSSVNFLTSYLNKPLKRGAHIHLEALAWAITSDSHLKYVFI